MFRVFCFSTWAWKGIAHLGWQALPLQLAAVAEWPSITGSVGFTPGICSELQFPVAALLVSFATHQANPQATNLHKFIGVSRYLIGKSLGKYTNMSFRVWELISCTSGGSQERPSVYLEKRNIFVSLKIFQETFFKIIFQKKNVFFKGVTFERRQSTASSDHWTIFCIEALQKCNIQTKMKQ